MPEDGTDHDPQVRQDIAARRDAYAAQYQVINNFPAALLPEQPTAQRQVWGDVPARNLGFTGREELLGAVRAALASADRAVVQALRGMGGVGKTQLAIEYAHRFATGYDIVWWIAAEQLTLIAEQFTALAATLGYTQPGADDAAVRRNVLGELRRRERWLLVFDNAENPEDVIPWLPGGTGHVLITSRSHGWEEVAVPVEVDVLDRTESVALLRRRVPGLSEANADLVADALGDLPLAVAQAAGYMAPSGITAEEYVRLVEARTSEILDVGRPASYPLSLAAVTQLALARLEAQDPAAAQAVRICAFLAPEPIPVGWFANAAEQLPQPLGIVGADPLAWGKTLARISGQALARIDQHGLVMHRLTQAILRTWLSLDEAAAARVQAAALLAASHPGDSEDLSTWPGWARLLPHLLVLDPEASTGALHGLTNAAVWYLIRHGTLRDANDLARSLYRNVLAQNGPDHPSTFDAAIALAHVMKCTGRDAEARELEEDTLARCRRVLGEDHPSTLTSASYFATTLRNLGEYQAARELDEDTLARCRRVLGEDHPLNVTSAFHLSIDLYELGEYQAARELAEDALVCRRRLLGEDHPFTSAPSSSSPTPCASWASTRRRGNWTRTPWPGTVGS